MLHFMVQILIEVDDDLSRELERVAPAASRSRSRFVRDAIWKAIWELQERRTAEAYSKLPDRAEDAYFDSSVWDRTAPAPPPAPRARRVATRRRR